MKKKFKKTLLLISLLLSISSINTIAMREKNNRLTPGYTISNGVKKFIGNYNKDNNTTTPGNDDSSLIPNNVKDIIVEEVLKNENSTPQHESESNLMNLPQISNTTTPGNDDSSLIPNNIKHIIVEEFLKNENPITINNNNNLRNLNQINKITTHNHNNDTYDLNKDLIQKIGENHRKRNYSTAKKNRNNNIFNLNKIANKIIENRYNNDKRIANKYLDNYENSPLDETMKLLHEHNILKKKSNNNINNQNNSTFRNNNVNNNRNNQSIEEKEIKNLDNIIRKHKDSGNNINEGNYVYSKDLNTKKETYKEFIGKILLDNTIPFILNAKRKLNEALKEKNVQKIEKISKEILVGILKIHYETQLKNIRNKEEEKILTEQIKNNSIKMFVEEIHRNITLIKTQNEKYIATIKNREIIEKIMNFAEGIKTTSDDKLQNGTFKRIYGLSSHFMSYIQNILNNNLEN